MLQSAQGLQGLCATGLCSSFSLWKVYHYSSPGGRRGCSTVLTNLQSCDGDVYHCPVTILPRMSLGTQCQEPQAAMLKHLACKMPQHLL